MSFKAHCPAIRVPIGFTYIHSVVTLDRFHILSAQRLDLLLFKMVRLPFFVIGTFQGGTIRANLDFIVSLFAGVNAKQQLPIWLLCLFELSLRLLKTQLIAAAIVFGFPLALDVFEVVQ